MVFFRNYMEGEKHQTHDTSAPHPQKTPLAPEGGVAFETPLKMPEESLPGEVPTMTEVDQELSKSGVNHDVKTGFVPRTASPAPRDPESKEIHDNVPSWLADKKASLASKPAPKVEPKPVPPQSAPTQKQKEATIADIKAREHSDLLRPLRTYKDDIARAIKRSKVSKTDMAVAQQQRNLSRMEEERAQLELKEKIEKDNARLGALKQKAQRPPEPKKPEPEYQPQPKPPPAPKPEPLTPQPEPPAEPSLTITKGDTYERGELAHQAALARGNAQGRVSKPPPAKKPEPTVSEKQRVELERRLQEAQQTYQKKADLIRETTPVRIEERAPLSKGMRVALISFGLLVLGSGVLAGTLYLYRDRPTPLGPLETGALVFAESMLEIPIQGMRGDTLLEYMALRISEQQLAPGTIQGIQLLAPARGERQVELTTQEWFSSAETGAPAALVRAFHPKFMLGIHGMGANQPFLVFKTSFYENAFAGMLDWELTMSRDLSPLFGPAIIAENATEISPTGSRFKDQLINNLDTRVLLDLNGEARLLYSFIDRQTLIVTTSRDTFLEVTDRLNSTQVAR